MLSAGFLTILPLLFYGALMISSDDPGGPLNFIIIPIGSAILGFVISLLVFFPLGLFADHVGLRRWQQVTGIISGLLLVAVIVMWIRYGVKNPESHQVILLFAASHLCFYIIGGFFVYLCSLRFFGRPAP